MKSPFHQRKHAGFAAILALGFMFWSSGASGVNTVPYAENFQDEAYPHGTPITNLTGWSASASDSSTIVTNDFVFETVTRPIYPSGDNKVLELNTYLFAVAQPWFVDPQLRHSAPVGDGDGPHYWCKDASDQFIFATPMPGNGDRPSYLYALADLIAADSTDTVAPVASVDTSSELGVSHFRGGAISDDLGRVLSGTSVPSESPPVYGSLPTDGTAWTSNNVARITNDQGVIHDGMAFNHDSTKLFSNSYGSPRNVLHTWTVGDLTTDGVGLTLLNTFTTSVARVRNVRAYYIGGQDLVYYGEGTGTGDKPVIVFDPSTETETVLIQNIGADVNNVNVSGIGAEQMYLYVGYGTGRMAVFELDADGKGVGDRLVEEFIFSSEVMNDGTKHNRAFEVMNNGQYAFFGYHETNPKNVHTVSSDPALLATPTMIMIR